MIVRAGSGLTGLRSRRPRRRSGRSSLRVRRPGPAEAEEVGTGVAAAGSSRSPGAVRRQRSSSERRDRWSARTAPSRCPRTSPPATRAAARSTPSTRSRDRWPSLVCASGKVADDDAARHPERPCHQRERGREVNAVALAHFEERGHRVGARSVEPLLDGRVERVGEVRPAEPGLQCDERVIVVGGAGGDLGRELADDRCDLRGQCCRAIALIAVRPQGERGSARASAGARSSRPRSSGPGSMRPGVRTVRLYGAAAHRPCSPLTSTAG